MEESSLIKLSSRLSIKLGGGSKGAYTPLTDTANSYSKYLDFAQGLPPRAKPSNCLRNISMILLWDYACRVLLRFTPKFRNVCVCVVRVLL